MSSTIKLKSSTAEVKRKKLRDSINAFLERRDQKPASYAKSNWHAEELCKISQDLFENRRLWAKSRKTFWRELVLGHDGEVNPKRIDSLRFVIMSMSPTYEQKASKTLLAMAMIRQLRENGMDVLTAPHDKNLYETWRTWLADFARDAVQKHTEVLLKGKTPIYGLTNEDFVLLWRKTAELWDRKNPVVLHTPVKYMAQAGSFLASYGLLEIKHLEGLIPDLLSLLEDKANGTGPRAEMLKRGADPETLDGLVYLSKKKHLTEIAQKNIPHINEPVLAPKTRM